jgi:hypothetical protein
MLFFFAVCYSPLLFGIERTQIECWCSKKSHQARSTCLENEWRMHTEPNIVKGNAKWCVTVLYH